MKVAAANPVKSPTAPPPNAMRRDFRSNPFLAVNSTSCLYTSNDFASSPRGVVNKWISKSSDNSFKKASKCNSFTFSSVTIQIFEGLN